MLPVVCLHWHSCTCYAENINDPSVTMMASSICSLLFDFTSEDALAGHSNFDESTLNSLCRLIARSMASWGQVLLRLVSHHFYLLSLGRETEAQDQHLAKNFNFWIIDVFWNVEDYTSFGLLCFISYIPSGAYVYD